MDYKLIINSENNDLINIEDKDNIYCYFLNLNILETQKIEDFFNDEKNLQRRLDNIKEKYIQLLDEEDIADIEDYISFDAYNLFKKIEYISFDEEVDILEYIKENPIILKKKIVLPGKYSFIDGNCSKNIEELYEVIEEYEDIIDNIYVAIDGNDEYVDIISAIETVNKIKQMAANIKKLNLSPMENVLYAYDLTRSRMYKEENENEDGKISRDLTDVLTGDKIVCVGFAHIFQALLNYLDIKCYINKLYGINKNKYGHARNVAYIKDDKYKIDGVYYFDTTWDNKKAENDSIYPHKYKYFAKTKNYMDEINKKNNFEDRNINLSIDETYTKLKENIENENYQYIIENRSNILNPLFRFVNRFNEATSIFIDIKRNTIDKKELLNKIEEIYSKYNNEISASTMFKLFVNVRKLYGHDLEDFSFSREDIIEIFKFNNWISSQEQTFICSIFGFDYYSKEMFLADLDKEFNKNNQKVLQKNTKN